LTTSLKKNSRIRFLHLELNYFMTLRLFAQKKNKGNDEERHPNYPQTEGYTASD
jgi:hypothetical protein